jgi:hypothetical protein
MPSDLILSAIKGLESTSRDIRYRSACELCELGGEARLAVPSLMMALWDEDEWVGSWCAAALGRVHPVAEEAIPILIARLGTDNERLGFACAEALWRMGQVAVPPLFVAIKEGNEQARERSVLALSWLKPVSADVIAALISALGDSCEGVRNASANALGYIGLPALPALVGAIKHEDEWVRAKSAYTIGRMGLKAKEAVPVLVNALRDKSRRVRSKSARALNRIKAEEEEEQERLREQATESSRTKETPNRAGVTGPREGRGRGPEIFTRMRDALRVLAGVRPAEVSFDELDRRIGECCACAAADKITGLLAPDMDDLDAFDRLHVEVTRLVIAAIAEYASHEARHGLVCRAALRTEQSRRTMPEERAQSDIPF